MSHQRAPEQRINAVEHLLVVVTWTDAAFDLYRDRFDALKLLIGQFRATAEHGASAEFVGPTVQPLRTEIFIRWCLNPKPRGAKNRGMIYSP